MYCTPVQIFNGAEDPIPGTFLGRYLAGPDGPGKTQKTPGCFFPGEPGFLAYLLHLVAGYVGIVVLSHASQDLGLHVPAKLLAGITYEHTSPNRTARLPPQPH